MADIIYQTADFEVGAGATTLAVSVGEDGIGAGQPVYKDATAANRIKKADADAQASAACVGLMCGVGYIGQPGVIVTAGEVTFNNAPFTVGQTYVVSTTAGGIAPISDLSSGDFTTILGVARTTAILDLNIVVGGAAKA